MHDELASRSTSTFHVYGTLLCRFLSNARSDSNKYFPASTGISWTVYTDRRSVAVKDTNRRSSDLTSLYTVDMHAKKTKGKCKNSSRTMAKTSAPVARKPWPPTPERPAAPCRPCFPSPQTHRADPNSARGACARSATGSDAHRHKSS